MHFRRILLLLLTSVLLASSPARGQEPVQWGEFDIPEFGTRLQYPVSIFAPAGDPPKGIGRRFEGPEPRTGLVVYASANELGDTPSGYLRRNLRVTEGLDYWRVTDRFFALSMEREGVIYYSRCNFSHAPVDAIHCFDLVYPREQKRAWDGIVTRMSLSLRP